MNFTPNQLEAINHRDGNLKIIACAGSGKTTVMSERIAHLISEGEDRDKIVAFTFTEKAAASLKFSIRESLQTHCPDASYLGGMFIGTIHSFAFEKIKDIVPKYRSFDILDEVKRIIWVSKKYRQIGIDGIRGNRGYFESIQQFLRTADIIRDNEIPETSLNNLPDFKEAYENYLRLLEEEKYLDFSGMINLFVNILRQNEALLAEVRSGIRHLVVDEYQDINHIQEELISLISGTDCDLCVVGDDDQSIFEFQGAQVNNIIGFETRYSNVHQVTMQDNFRCPREIIEAARNFIGRNRNRLAKNMIPGSVNGAVKTSQQGDVYKLEFGSINDEVAYIVSKIQGLRGCEYTEETVSRGLDYGDMAVIVRTRLSAERFIEAFRTAGIPFTLKGTGGLFQRPEIDFIRHVLCYFAGHSHQFNQPAVTLADLETAFNRLNFTHVRWNDVSPRLAEQKLFIESINRENPNPNHQRIFLQDFYYTLMGILGITQTNFAEDIMYDFGRLSKLIAEFEAVHGWINYFYFQQFVMFINGYARERTDEGGLDDPRNTNSVSILTVHQAKGLEFPVVFIPDLSTRRFPSQQRNREPDTYLEGIFNLQGYCSGEEGERRLFYVAATRTKKFLFVTRSNQSDTGGNARRSVYFTEFDHEIMLQRNIPDPTTRTRLTPQCSPDLELMPTSFSDLKYYIGCPYRYQLQQMMGFSPVLNTSYGYGLQVHNLLNYMHKKWEQTPPTHAEIEALVESDFFLRFTRGRPFENMKGKAKEILKAYVTDFGHEFPLKLETEKPFELILGGALISGSIDLIQKINAESREIQEVGIIDFKTEKEKLETKPFIRLQLRLYALAGGRALGLNPANASIHYLTEQAREDIDVSDGKLTETQTEIEGVIGNIKRGQFSPCPGGHCPECDVRYVCHRRQGA